ncbi:hypothetical protein HPB47_009476 [Ixodes persulcatus]|uniref:Uncharacterized protein n=1 Tax=Ixodes persulcatus TaxID=34615 RepID=A0AC60P1U6_IXOPE|nr:hypothetical protein HPB47_009476 [Ixodes persulcatus]
MLFWTCAKKDPSPYGLQYFSEGCNRAQDQRRGAPTIERKESGSPSSTLDDDKLADSVDDSVKLLAGPDDNRDERPGEDTSTPAKSKASAKSVVRPPWGVKKEVLIVGDSNVGRFAPAFSERMGGGQNFDVLLNRKATVEIAHRMIADYEATARRIPRMYILHVGMQDLLQGQQPDDIVECLEKKWCFRQVALTVCSVPEVTSRGKETQAAAMMLNSRLRKMCKRIHAKYVDLSSNLVNDGFMEKDGLRYSNQGIHMVTGRLVGLANRFLGRQGKDRRMKALQNREQDGLVNPAQQRPIHEPMNQTAGRECGQTRTAPLLVGHVPCEELVQQRLSQGAYVRRQQDGEKKDQLTQQGTTTQERHAHSGWQPSMRGGTLAYPERGWVHPGLMRHPTGIGLSMVDAPRRIQEDPPLQYHRVDITAELTPGLDGRTPVYPPPLVRHPMHMSPPAMHPLWLSGLVAETVRQQLGIGRQRGSHKGGLKRGAARRKRKKHHRSLTVTVGFLNLQGARREHKWEELFNQLESEGMAIYGVAETHLRDLEEPPVHPGWHWAGCNRQEGQRRGGGVGKMFVYTYLMGVQTGWRKRLYQLEKKYGFFSTPVTITTDRKWETEIRKRVREEEAARWAETAKSKSTLYMYHRYKHEISAETRLYDNSLGSRLLFESRAGGLRTQVYCRRFDQTVESAACRVCGQADETIEHIVLSCTGLQPVQPAECGQATREVALAEALGFGSASSSVGGTNGNNNVDAKPITNGGWRERVEATKRRLENWWMLVHQRG